MQYIDKDIYFGVLEEVMLEMVHPEDVKYVAGYIEIIYSGNTNNIKDNMFPFENKAAMEDFVVSTLTEYPELSLVLFLHDFIDIVITRLGTYIYE